MKDKWTHFLGWEHKQLQDLQMVAFLYLEQGKYDIAKTFLEALTVLKPEEPYNWQTLGSVRLELKEFNEAIFCFDTALKLDPLHYPTLLNKAQALFSLKKLPEAYEITETLKTCPHPNVAKQASFLYSLLEKAF